MAWIESHQTLREHPKTYALMDALGIEKATALGHLHMFWWWCIDYALDGRMTPNPAQLARAADWKGDADVFASAMLKTEWIDRDGDAWSVHDWHDYCGELVEKRLERKDFKRRRVAEKRRTKTAARQTNPDEIGTNSAKNPPTLPYPTVPNHTLNTAPPPKDGDGTENTTAYKTNNDLQKIVLGWKILNGVEKDDRAWDKVHYKKNVPYAQQLLTLFNGDVSASLDCMENLFDKFKKQGFDFSLAGVVKHSTEYRKNWLERLAKKGA